MTVRKTVTAVILLLLCLGCSSHDSRAEVVPSSCLTSSPSESIKTSFTAKVTSIKKNALHIDFDGFGSDFDSLEIRFQSPQEWNGLVGSIYFQGDAVINDVKLISGTSFSFEATPPQCLDQPWLYLSDLSKS